MCSQELRLLEEYFVINVSRGSSPYCLGWHLVKQHTSLQVPSRDTDAEVISPHLAHLQSKAFREVEDSVQKTGWEALSCEVFVTYRSPVHFVLTYV